jgi:uncharacterized protein YndB with AHSA1/START domain
MTSPDLHLTRIVPAPVEDVFAAWTDPAVLVRWWGRGGDDRVREAQLDPRVGGRYRIVVDGAEGRTYELAGTYTDVDPPHRLAFTWQFVSGGPGDGESHVSVELRPAGDATELVLSHGGFPDDAAAAPYSSGWDQALPRLVALFA